MYPHPSFPAATFVYAFCVRSASHLGRTFGTAFGFFAITHAIIYLFLNRLYFSFFLSFGFLSGCRVGLYVHRNVNYQNMGEAF
jgi:hypothetical protein